MDKDTVLLILSYFYLGISCIALILSVIRFVMIIKGL